MASPEASDSIPKSFPILQWWKTFHGDDLAKFPSQKQSLVPKDSDSGRSTNDENDGLQGNITENDVVPSSNRNPNALQTDKQELARNEGTGENGNKTGNQQTHDGVGDGQASTMFGAGAKVLIHGGNPTFQHINITNQGKDASNTADLYSRSAPSAAFNSKERYEPPECHPNTRVEFLKRVEDWAANGPLRLMWLHGPAGVGKSAVAQTTAATLHKDGKLAASFFFSKTAPPESHRGHEERFVTTIAHQLTENIPGLRKLVQNVIENKPSVFDLNLSQQVMELILEPMKQLPRGGMIPLLASRPPNVIVVDGLDECQDEAGQKQVLEAIATLVRHPDIFNFSIFLSSRKELAIRLWFASLDDKTEALVDKVSLLYHCNNDDDIRTVVLDKMSSIRKTHPLKTQLPPSWPSTDDVETIVKRASGQFIYATTMLKYISDPRHHPYRRLDYIIHKTIPDTDHPYTALDLLYLSILRNAQHPTHVRLFLCFCVVSASYKGHFEAQSFFDFLESFFTLPCPVITLVTDLHSIIIDIAKATYNLSPSSKSAMTQIPKIFQHASLPEFLLDPRRSMEFHVDIQKFDLQLFDLTLKHLQDPHRQRNLTSDEDYCFVVYAFVHMLQTKASTLESSRQRVADELAKWDTFDDGLLYSILQVLCSSPAHRFGTAEDQLVKFNMILQPTPSSQILFAKAMERKITQCYEILSRENIPLELFLLFYGTESSFFDYELPRSKNMPEQGWRAVLGWHMIFFCGQHTTCDLWEFFGEEAPRPFKRHPFHRPVWIDLFAIMDLGWLEHEQSNLQPAHSPHSNGCKCLGCSSTITSAIVFYLKHLRYILDPTLSDQGFAKPEDLEVIALLETVVGRRPRRDESSNYCRRLSFVFSLLGRLDYFLWSHVPLSSSVVSEFEELFSCCFSATALAGYNINIPGATFLKLVGPHWESAQASPSLPPLLFFTKNSHPNVYSSVGTINHWNDYTRLYYLCADTLSEEVFFSKPACSLALQTKDPETGHNINLDDWSTQSRISRLVSALREKRQNQAGFMYYWGMLQRLWYKFYRPEEFAAEELILKHWKDTPRWNGARVISTSNL
ncbi:hypothetical protein CVT24_001471 [Panaeolus cyanescens]|uniref:Nephrocystin 3-like N-terminal domain-containing protein n=1 Tax=Panaeolus cyanescens TaxID=181874 RepID=A0A409VTE1_9AGAR|nr:hypothetical protein CVT24_001471 [Panaeolus cyanescens]